ncbi:MAG: hypothetical protein ACXABO_09075 [Promethearchaeota archaeon]|jgi:rubrerythrin
MNYNIIRDFCDLTKDLLKKKEIIKSIKYYIEEKNKANIQSHYSLLIFQDEGNPIFITDKKDSAIIANSIEENWKFRPKKQSFFENGLFYIFSYIAETVRKKSKFNRVIVITDTPSDLSADYQEALFNLVSVIKNFPTFIDVIRLSDSNERFFSDDVKLNMLAADTKGSIFYIKEKKEFSNIIKKLVKTKQFVSIFADQPDRIKISKEDYAFYNRLAKPLIKTKGSMEKLVCNFCKEEVCPICSDIYDIPLTCEDCNTNFHNCCLTNYTINHNIGIPNILRCPVSTCDTLIKIDEDEIIELSGEVEVKTVKEYMAKEVLDQIPRRIPQVKELPTSTLGGNAMNDTSDESIPAQTNLESDKGNVKIVRVGGFFGKVYTVKKVDDKIVYERVSKKTTFTSSNTVEKSKNISPTSDKSLNAERNKSASLAICQQCGTQINTNQQLKCPNCGYKL